MWDIHYSIAVIQARLAWSKAVEILRRSPEVPAKFVEFLKDTHDISEAIKILRLFPEVVPKELVETLEYALYKSQSSDSHNVLGIGASSTRPMVDFPFNNGTGLRVRKGYASHPLSQTDFPFNNGTGLRVRKGYASHPLSQTDSRLAFTPEGKSAARARDALFSGMCLPGSQSLTQSQKRFLDYFKLVCGSEPQFGTAPTHFSAIYGHLCIPLTASTARIHSPLPGARYVCANVRPAEPRQVRIARLQSLSEILVNRDDSTFYLVTQDLPLSIEDLYLLDWQRDVSALMPSYRSRLLATQLALRDWRRRASCMTPLILAR